MPEKIRAVAFDAVGTLIEAVPSVAEAYRWAGLKVGLDLPTEIIRQRFYQVFSADDTNGSNATNEPNERKRWRRIVGFCLPELGEKEANFAFDLLWEHFANPNHWRLFDDVAETVATLHESGLNLCVASNFDARLRGVWAGLIGVEMLSDRLIISSEVGERKPGKGFYEAVTRQLGVPVNEILFVGDDWVNDIATPASLGFQTALIDRKGRMARPGSLQSLAELVGLIV